MVRLESELFHAALNIMQTRDAQLAALGDDELMHYGRKGMKWNENIFAKINERLNDANSARERANGARIRENQQNIRESQAKYGGQHTPWTPSVEEANAYRSQQERANGARIRENQQNIREAQAKYGSGSNSDYANKMMAEQERRRQYRESYDQWKRNNDAASKYGPKYGDDNTWTPSVEEANDYRSAQERANGARIREQQKKQREAAAKYGDDNTWTPSVEEANDYRSQQERANGARIRENQQNIREAQEKYGSGSNSDYANKAMAEQERQRQYRESYDQWKRNNDAASKYGAKYGGQHAPWTPSVEEANDYRSAQERANGARVRERQRKQREAAAKYGK